MAVELDPLRTLTRNARGSLDRESATPASSEQIKLSHEFWARACNLLTRFQDMGYRDDVYAATHPVSYSAPGVKDRDGMRIKGFIKDESDGVGGIISDGSVSLVFETKDESLPLFSVEKTFNIESNEEAWSKATGRNFRGGVATEEELRAAIRVLQAYERRAIIDENYPSRKLKPSLDLE